MRKKKAIAILTAHQRALYQTFSKEVWRTQTAGYMRKFFGEPSPQYYFITTLNLDAEDVLSVSEEFIKTSIDSINKFGVYRPPNFLIKIKTEWLIFVISATIPAIFSLGTLLGKYLSDTQNIDLRREIKELKVQLYPIVAPTNQDSTTKANNTREKGDTTDN